MFSYFGSIVHGALTQTICATYFSIATIAKVGQFGLQPLTFLATDEATLKAQGADDPFCAVRPFFEPGAQPRKVS
jgi:hypothetical protein